MKIASLGGIEAIIAVMSAHKDHSDVQEKACAALWTLAGYDGMVWCRYRCDSCLDHSFFSDAFSLSCILFDALPFDCYVE